MHTLALAQTSLVKLDMAMLGFNPTYKSCILDTPLGWSEQSELQHCRAVPWEFALLTPTYAVPEALISRTADSNASSSTLPSQVLP